MLGRTVGLVYTVPLVYFMLRKKLPKELYKRFGALFTLGATQGLVGWWMVRSGLEDHGKEQLEKRNEVRVSPYRLATHVRIRFCSRANYHGKSLTGIGIFIITSLHLHSRRWEFFYGQVSA